MIDQLSDTVTHLHLRQTIRGRPTVLAVAAGIHAAYARSGSGAVLSLDPPGAEAPRWSYRNLDGVSSDVKGAAVSLSRQDIFVRDRKLRLRQRVLSGGVWGGWIDHDGALASEPRPVVDSSGAVKVFVRGADFGLWFLDGTAAAPGSWNSLSGVLTSAPAPVSTGGGSLSVFVRGLDRGLWRRIWNGASWSGWRPLKGVLATGPAVASTGSGRIDVAALDDAGALTHLRFDGSEWSHWRNLGGAVEGDIAMVAGTPDRIDIFATRKGRPTLDDCARGRALERLDRAWRETHIGAVGGSRQSGTTCLCARRRWRPRVSRADRRRMVRMAASRRGHRRHPRSPRHGDLSSLGPRHHVPRL